MFWLRPSLWFLSTLAALVALGVGSLAALGRARWGDAGWYFHGGPDYRFRHGQSLLRHGDADRALRLADLLETDGFADQAALLRGEAHFRQGEYLDAREPGLASAQWARGLEEFAKIRDQGDLRLDGAVFVGQCYVHLKQYRAAENALKVVVSQRPDAIDAHPCL